MASDIHMGCMTLSKIVNGASLKPRSGEPPKKIVLLLHGFGSSGTDMIALAPAWQEALPDTLFLAPHARSEERRVGKECVSTCRSRWSPDHYKKHTTNKK